MGIFNLFKGKSFLAKKINKIESEIKSTISDHFKGSFWIFRYGSYDINPKYLVIWVCVDLENEKEELASDIDLMKKLRQILTDNSYPAEAIPYVHIGYESQETVDKTSNGNWHYHFK